MAPATGYYDQIGICILVDKSGHGMCYYGGLSHVESRQGSWSYILGERPSPRECIILVFVHSSGGRFSSMIKGSAKSCNTHGISMARNAPSVTHLFFVDDSYIFFKAKESEASHL